MTRRNRAANRPASVCHPPERNRRVVHGRREPELSTEWAGMRWTGPRCRTRYPHDAARCAGPERRGRSRRDPPSSSASSHGSREPPSAAGSSCGPVEDGWPQLPRTGSCSQQRARVAVWAVRRPRVGSGCGSSTIRGSTSRYRAIPATPGHPRTQQCTGAGACGIAITSCATRSRQFSGTSPTVSPPRPPCARSTPPSTRARSRWPNSKSSSSTPVGELSSFLCSTRPPSRASRRSCGVDYWSPGS